MKTNKIMGGIFLKKLTRLYLTKYHTPAEYELWLEKYAKDGWRLGSISSPSSFWGFHKFTESESRKTRYFYDIQKACGQDYEQKLRSLGWELVFCYYNSESTFLWRKDYENKRPEVYNDMSMLQARNKKVLTHQLFYLAALVIMFSVYLYNICDKYSITMTTYTVSLIFLLPIFYLSYGVSKLLRVVLQVKSRKQRKENS